MTEQQGAPKAEKAPMERMIIFRGREIYVKLPTAEQLLVWQRTLRRLQDDDDVEGWDGHEALRAMERLRKILDSVIASTTDIEWLDDEMLLGRLDLNDLAEIIPATVTVFSEETGGNRTEKRAAKKAARRKATTS